MSTLQESLQKFVVPKYKKVRRNAGTYYSVKAYCTKNLQSLRREYLDLGQEHNFDNAQTLRELRNSIDYYLRRYQKYCIEERHTAHYLQCGTVQEQDFEHLIPAARVRDLYIGGVLSVDQALNSPTVLLSRQDHKLLNSKGLASYTPNLWLPFQRYKILGATNFKTHNGHVIDIDSWTLGDHYRHFEKVEVSLAKKVNC